MKAPKTAAEISKNWLAGMNAATTQDKYKQGIQRTAAAGINPMALAATEAAQMKYRQATAEASNGRMASALQAVPPTRWSNNAVNNASNLGTGANRAKDKQAAAAVKWAPVYAQSSQAAADVTGPLEKVRASINVMKAAAGKPLI